MIVAKNVVVAPSLKRSFWMDSNGILGLVITESAYPLYNNAFKLVFGSSPCYEFKDNGFEDKHFRGWEAEDWFSILCSQDSQYFNAFRWHSVRYGSIKFCGLQWM